MKRYIILFIIIACSQLLNTTARLSAQTRRVPVSGVTNDSLRTGSIALKDTLIERDSVMWEDLTSPAILSRLPTSGSATLNEDSLTIDFSATQTNTAYFVFQLSHATVQDTAHSLNIHVHWTQRDTGEVVWQTLVQIMPLGGVPGVWTTTSTSTGVFTYEGKPLHQISSLVDIPSETVNISSVIKVKLSRIGGDGQDTYPAVARVLAVDIHYPRDTKGGSKYETRRY